jgi:hypothetical protein
MTLGVSYEGEKTDGFVLELDYYVATQTCSNDGRGKEREERIKYTRYEPLRLKN